MPYMLFDDKLEAIYSVICQKEKWQSANKIATGLGYSQRSAIDDALMWLIDHDYIEASQQARPQGGMMYVVRPKIHPCETLRKDDSA